MIDRVVGATAEAREIRVPDERRAHILDGDPDGRGGGHRHGTGRRGKTEFPEGWSDDRIIALIEDVARHPDRPPEQQPNKRWVCRGVRDDVEVVAVVNPDGRVWTGFPRPGGPGVVENPKESR